MTKLEENNLAAQSELMSDIIQNYKNIDYHVAENGKKLLELLRTSKFNEKEKAKIISEENFNKILDIVYILSDTEKFDKLGILARTAVPDNEIKLKILSILRK